MSDSKSIWWALLLLGCGSDAGPPAPASTSQDDVTATLPGPTILAPTSSVVGPSDEQPASAAVDSDSHVESAAVIDSPVVVVQDESQPEAEVPQAEVPEAEDSSPDDDPQSTAPSVEASPSAGASPAPDAPSAGCSGKTALPGTTSRTLSLDGLTREYIVHIPTGVDANQPVPIVYVVHGWAMNGQAMFDQTKLADLADREGFVAVFPTGTGGALNVLASPWGVSPAGATVCGSGALVDNKASDDIAFMKAILKDVEQDQCIDEAAVFVTGFSMGGFFSNHIACQGGDFVRAVAPHSGGTYSDGGCSGTPVPVLILHGTGDGVIDYSCGEQARDLWIERNGCSTNATSEVVEGGTCERFDDCSERGEVVMCTFPDMGHGWAGSEANAYGTGPGYEDASEFVWRFFAEQLQRH